MNTYECNIYDALPYDIIRRIRHHFVTKDDNNDGKDSVYIELYGKKLEIRVSNHCTHLWTWHERKYGNEDDITRISIVFEETNTYDSKNLILRRHRNTPIKVMEYVYRIANPNEFCKKDVDAVLDSIKFCIKTGNIYEDRTGKLSYSKERISINPSSNGDDKVNEDKAIRTITNKPVISHLTKIIRESIKKVLNIL